jgi:hypothetical protein
LTVTHVVLQLREGAIDAERKGADEVVITARNGKAEEHFFRVGSAAFQTGRANTLPSDPAQQTPRLDFDRSVPLERYADLSPDGSTDGLAYLYAALREPPLTDDEKLSLLSVETAKEHDAFKRRDLAQTVLPDINKRLADVAQQRYYRIAVNAVGSTGNAWTWNGPVTLLGAYDLDRKGFPSSCVATGVVLPVAHLDDARTYLSLRFNQEEPPPATCFLPVPDETVARAMEAARTKPQGIWASRVTAYFYAARAGGKAVSAVLTHATLTFDTPSSDGTGQQSDVEVSFPQPPSPP